MRIYAGDTEDDSKGKMHLINIFDGKKHSSFTERADAIEFLQTLRGHCHIWFCNLQYDINNIFGTENIHLLEIIYIGSRVIEARLIGTDVRFRDTLNHWKISVAEMGKRIGLKKLEAQGTDSKYNDLKYCRRDTRIVYKFVESMAKKYESINAELKATIGATSLKYFETNFYRHCNFTFIKKKEIEFMLKGYYGGRTEIFFNHPITGNIQYYDINSLYPFCCQKPMPIVHKKSYRFTKTPDFTKEGIVYARVKAPKKIEIPYLPYRSRDGKLLFPLGTFSGHWTYFEIREAKKLGYEIIKIHKAIEFFRGVGPVMGEFVETLYNKRLEAKKEKDELLSDAYKLIMNNLYGKFAQKNEKTKLMPYEGKNKLKRGDIIMNNIVLSKTLGDYPRQTNVIWSAYITAYGRHEIYERMVRVVRNHGLLIYCDTDSVIFEHRDNLFTDDNAIGKVKLEGKFKYAHFRLPKEYKLVSQDDTKIYKTKGVPKKSQAEFFENKKVSFERPYKLREVLRRNLSPKRILKLKPNFWDTIEKQSSKIYDKRIVFKDGSTKPITIGG